MLTESLRTAKTRFKLKKRIYLMRFFSCLISFVSRCIAAACIESVGLYIANVLTFKRITTRGHKDGRKGSWTLYCKCTNFQANHNACSDVNISPVVGLYIANVLTFKRITTEIHFIPKFIMLDSILQMY